MEYPIKQKESNLDKKTVKEKTNTIYVNDKYHGIEGLVLLALDFPATTGRWKEPAHAYLW